MVPVLRLQGLLGVKEVCQSLGMCGLPGISLLYCIKADIITTWRFAVTRVINYHYQLSGVCVCEVQRVQCRSVYTVHNTIVHCSPWHILCYALCSPQLLLCSQWCAIVLQMYAIVVQMACYYGKLTLKVTSRWWWSYWWIKLNYTNSRHCGVSLIECTEYSTTFRPQEVTYFLPAVILGKIGLGTRLRVHRHAYA